MRTRLLDSGHEVIGIDRHEADIEVDLGTEAGREKALTAVRDRTDALEGVASCAGLSPTQDAGDIVRVNYFGAMAMLDGSFELLRRGSAPSAVGIASVAALFDMLSQDEVLAACHAGDEEAAASALAGRDGNTGYCNAKRALAQGIRRRAPAWGAAGVRLNAVAPGKMNTPMLADLLGSADHRDAIEGLPVPLGRVGSPDDIGRAVCFLLSEDACYVHGQVLYVDGGCDAQVRPDLV